MSNKREAAGLPKRPDLTLGQPWGVKLEPIDGMLPFGRWRITLERGLLRYGGGDGWGWLAWTERGARRKGDRELARLNRREGKLRARRVAAGLDPEEG